MHFNFFLLPPQELVLGQQFGQSSSPPLVDHNEHFLHHLQGVHTAGASFEDHGASRELLLFPWLHCMGHRVLYCALLFLWEVVLGVGHLVECLFQSLLLLHRGLAVGADLLVGLDVAHQEYVQAIELAVSVQVGHLLAILTPTHVREVLVAHESVVGVVRALREIVLAGVHFLGPL